MPPSRDLREAHYRLQEANNDIKRLMSTCSSSGSQSVTSPWKRHQLKSRTQESKNSDSVSTPVGFKRDVEMLSSVPSMRLTEEEPQAVRVTEETFSLNNYRECSPVQLTPYGSPRRPLYSDRVPSPSCNSNISAPQYAAHHSGYVSDSPYRRNMHYTNTTPERVFRRSEVESDIDDYMSVSSSCHGMSYPRTVSPIRKQSVLQSDQIDSISPPRSQSSHSGTFDEIISCRRTPQLSHLKYSSSPIQTETLLNSDVINNINNRNHSISDSNYSPDIRRISFANSVGDERQLENENTHPQYTPTISGDNNNLVSFEDKSDEERVFVFNVTVEDDATPVYSELVSPTGDLSYKIKIYNWGDSGDISAASIYFCPVVGFPAKVDLTAHAAGCVVGRGSLSSSDFAKQSSPSRGKDGIGWSGLVSHASLPSSKKYSLMFNVTPVY